MATKKSAAKSTTYWWDATATDPVIASALAVLAKRYPALKAKKAPGAAELVFKKGADGVCSAAFGDGRYVITYGRPNMAVRMVGNILAGAVPAEAEQCPFTTLGIMLDCSRDAVMNVEHLKGYLDHLAILGYNMAMLYTEDTYRVAGEPMFGFMRGAYTQDEIREIDDYAASLGIELIPCIEALGHMEQIFKWGKYADVRDLNGILLVDEKKTYELIDKMVAFWAGCVRSKRIHLGMDEAHGLGTGAHEKRFGKESAFDIINRHLKKCCAICKKYGLRPMIWSDMYFRIGSKTNNYYDLDSQPSEEVVKGVPKKLELVYWDYYHAEQDFYEKFIEKHRQIAGDPLMGSGVWTWSKFWYDHFMTRNTVVPCLKACRAKNLKEVFSTMWGDNGGYCDYDSAYAGLAFAAELSFTGKADEARLEKVVSGLFGGSSYKAIIALGDIMNYSVPQLLFDDPLMLLYFRSFFNSEQKFQDYDRKADFGEVKKAFEDAAKVVFKAPLKGEAGSMALARALVSSVTSKFAYAEAAFKAVAKKDHRKDAPALLKLAKAYEKNISDFYGEFWKMWHEHNKPFGLESIQIRLGGQVIRAGELVIRLENFIASGDKVIPELAELATAGKEVNLHRWQGFLDIAKATGIF